MTLTLHRVADGAEWPSDDAPHFRGDIVPVCWAYTQGGETHYVLGREDEFTVLGLVPATVSPGQAKIALLRTPASDGTSASLYDQVNGFVAGLTDPSAREIAVWWASATEFDRASPHITAVAGALGLTGAQIDDLFQLAATIV